LTDNLTISIIIPVGKHEVHEADRTFLSLLRMKDTDVEVITVVDGVDILDVPDEDVSPLTMLDNVMSDFPEVSFKRATTILSAQPQGPSVARNIGVQSSTGHVITYLNVGDEIHPEWTSYLKFVYSQNIGIQLLLSAHNVLHPGAGMQLYDPHKIFQRLPQGRRKLDSILQYHNLVSALGISHRRESFFLVGGFQPGIASGEEGIFTRRVAQCLEPDKSYVTEAISGIHHYPVHTSKDFPHFLVNENHRLGSMGQYLDKEWYQSYTHSA